MFSKGFLQQYISTCGPETSFRLDEISTFRSLGHTWKLNTFISNIKHSIPARSGLLFGNFQRQECRSANKPNFLDIQIHAPDGSHAINSNNQRSTSTKIPGFYLINARSLLPKVDELTVLLNIHPVEFVAITETWLNDEVINQLIFINRYDIFRNDRSYGRGGGVCAFFSADIPSKRREDLENVAVECMWIWLHSYRLPRQLSGLSCCVLYNPPDTPL